MSLAVSALNSIKVYRATKPEEPSEGNYEFYEVLHIGIGNPLINEIAWAPGCLHSFDVIAAACDDGTIRIFHIDTPHDLDGSSRALSTRLPQLNGSSRAQLPISRNAPSGIGAGLANMSRVTASRRDVTNRLNIKHESREVAVLPHGGGSSVWKIRWIYDGNECYSSSLDNHVLKGRSVSKADD